MQPSLNKTQKLNRTNIATIGSITLCGKNAILNITTSEQKSNVANNTKVVLATIDSNLRPKESLVVSPVVAKDETYAIIPNCYILLRNTGDLEFYQVSGAAKNVKQILGTVSYFVK